MAEAGLGVLLESGSLDGDLETSGDRLLVEEVYATP